MTRKDVLALAILNHDVSLKDVDQVREFLQSRNIFFELRSIGQGSRQQVQIFSKGKGWLSLTDWMNNYLQGLQAELMSLQRRCESLGITTMDQALTLEQKLDFLSDVGVEFNADFHRPGDPSLSGLFQGIRVVHVENGKINLRKPERIYVVDKGKHSLWIRDVDDQDEVKEKLNRVIHRDRLNPSTR